MNPYLLKIKNDIDEGIWDLLLVHTWNEPDRISKESPYVEEFLTLLRQAIRKLDQECDGLRGKSNYQVQFARTKFRTMIILANKVLRYDKKNEAMKALKRRIIEEYTGSAPDDSEKIPLRYQIAELRITHDARYLEYMVRGFLKKEQYDKALYCLLTYKLIEPDHLKLESWRAQIRSWVSEPGLPTYEPAQQTDLVLLDANAIFPEVFDGHPVDPDAKLTPAIHAEVLNAWERRLGDARKSGTEAALRSSVEPRLESLKERLIDVEPASLKPIRDMYGEYLFKLEDILYRKISRMKSMSEKLKKLSERDTLLPEEGDLTLLAEAIALSKDHKVAILSRDEDFWAFQGPIRERFGIEVIRPERTQEAV